MRALALLLVAALPLAGCLGVVPGEVVEAADATVGPLVLLRWNGSALEGAPSDMRQGIESTACWVNARCADPPTPCEPANCARTPFTVPAGAGAVVLSVRWPTQPGLDIDAWIEDDAGAIVARTTSAYPGITGAAARLDDPAPGEYQAVLAVRTGRPAWEAAIHVEPPRPETAPRALLPNLITLPPTDLTLETPDYGGISYFVFQLPAVRETSESMGARGCRVDEVVEYQDARCLRFSNAVGNVGEGPLDVRLAPGSMEFVQRVHWSDGSYEDVPGGAAEWHATHAHWHNAANNAYTLHTYDVDTGARGPALHDGKKGGICFADTGLIDVAIANTRGPQETGTGCVDPTARDGREWRMGITPGWYDLYPFVLSDQYVDITGLPDGTYALCSITNGEGTLAETDTSDNEACTRFALTGNDLALLDPTPYHAMPPSAP